MRSVQNFLRIQSMLKLSSYPFCQGTQPSSQTLTPQTAQSLIKKWTKNNKVCVFMKGSPNNPGCGYSKLMIQILKYYGLQKYKYIDILQNAVIREQVKIYSKWPTYPQLFVDGQLIGGSDVVNQMHHDDSLQKLFIQKKVIQEKKTN